MEDLVHVRLTQSAAEGGEEQTGHQEGAAQGGREVIALQLRHGGQPRPGPSPGQPGAPSPEGGLNGPVLPDEVQQGRNAVDAGRALDGSVGSLFPEWSIYATHETVSLSITAWSSQSGQRLKEGRV